MGAGVGLVGFAGEVEHFDAGVGAEGAEAKEAGAAGKG